MKLNILIVFLSVQLSVMAQTEVDSATVAKLQSQEFGGIYKSSISVNVGGTSGIIGGSFEHFVNPHLQLEVGAGFPACGIGVNIYPWKIKRGAERFMFAYKGVYLNTPWRLPIYQHAIVLGLTFFTEKKWNWTLNVGPMYVHSTDNFNFIEPEGDSPLSVMVNIKGSYRFSFQAMKRNRELNKKID